MITFSYRVQQNFNRFVKYQRKYSFFCNGAFKLMELTIFLFWGLRYNLYIRWNFKIIKPSWKYVQFNKYYQVTFAVCNIQYMDWLYWYTNWLLGRDLSKFVSAIHKISILPSTISSNSPILFLMELIFWCEKIRLLRL